MTAKDAPDPCMAPQGAPSKSNALINVNRVKDTPVFYTFGDKIGAVVDLLVERSSGQSCQINSVRFCWAFDKPAAVTRPPCSR